MRTDDFDYELPQRLIAQRPLDDRAASRMLALNKADGTVRHDRFRRFTDYLNPGDCLVLNDTRVIPARLYGTKKDSGGAIEFLLLHRRSRDEWEVALRPGKKAKPGAVFEFGGGRLAAQILESLEGGNRLVRFHYDGLFENVLDKLGEMPLPHYITEKLADRERYQTVYSKREGSAAAPTAGLHFTGEMLAAIREKGVDTVFLTLHVGLGTFRPVKVENVDEHKMHSEFYTVSEDAADRINRAKAGGGRVICVGTTSCRAVESAAENGRVRAKTGWTDIFIYPGYAFQIADCLLTNFHLPKSTLMMLVSAIGGRENILRAYGEAVRGEYRFFSFGDCMLIY